MPALPDQIRNNPPAPVVATIPAPVYGYIDESIVAGGAAYLKPGHPTAGTQAGSDAWLTSVRSLMSFSLNVSGYASLVIQLTTDGTTWNIHEKPILLFQGMNVLSGIHLPAFEAKLQVLNSSSTVVCPIEGIVILEGA